MSSMPEEFWIELPPISPTAPRRLIVFLHAAGASNDALVPFAIAWQQKFPGATVALLAGNATAPRGGRQWFDHQPVAGRTERVERATEQAIDRLHALQGALGFEPRETILVGWSQGATMVVELARCLPAPAAVVVAYASQLARPLTAHEHPLPIIHLVHGEFDTVVPVVLGERAWRGLLAAGVDVSLDVLGDAAHELGPGMVALGTTRVMQTLFRGRRAASRVASRGSEQQTASTRPADTRTRSVH
jgi:phospholipase/carboxylesterase